jgi:hypothetical protein
MVPPYEKFEDSKGVTRSRKSKDRQCNGQNNKYALQQRYSKKKI